MERKSCTGRASPPKFVTHSANGEAQVLSAEGRHEISKFATFESSYVARAECPARYRRRSSVDKSTCFTLQLPHRYAGLMWWYPWMECPGMGRSPLTNKRWPTFWPLHPSYPQRYRSRVPI